MFARRLVPAAYALVTLAAAAALAATPAPLGAQLAAPRPAENPRGLFYSVRAGATEMMIEGVDQYFGVGGGGQVGYNLNRMFGLFVGFDYSRPGVPAEDFSTQQVAADDDFLVTHVEFGGRVNVPIGGRLLPYADAAYARRALSYSYLASPADGNQYVGRLKYWGNNVLVGGGVQLFLRPTVALDLGGRISFGELDRAQLNVAGAAYTGRFTGDDDGVRFTRLAAGATWYYPGFRFQ